jgi:hypothetical protein
MLPPLVVALVLLLFAGFCFIAEQREPPATRDDSVRFASVLVLVASVAGYPILLMINLLDSVFDRRGPRSWLWTACLISGFAMLTVLTKAGSEDLGSLVLGSLLVPSIVLLPMSVMRRIMKPRMTGVVHGSTHVPKLTNSCPPPRLSRTRTRKSSEATGDNVSS